MKTKPKKLTRLERDYLTHVQRAQARGMPLAQYCRAEGVNVQSLYNLRYQLSGKSRKGPKLSAKKSSPTDKFVAVQVDSGAVTAGAACRLHAKGWVIECSGLPPTAWLTGLMAGEADAVP